MGKIKASRASGERMRLNAQGPGAILKAPSEEGNEFDIQMCEHRNGQACVRQIARVLKDAGVCAIEANAPMEMLSAAHAEAESLWKNGAFGPAWQVFDESSRIDAQLWHPAMPDEEKVVWLRAPDSPNRPMTVLKALAKNMSDLSTGIMDRLQRELGLQYDCFWDVMLSCYTGDRQYDCHIDNPHQGDARGYPDNGMRLTLIYFINPHWEPSGDNGGGLDVFLTDPATPPKSAGEARKAPKHRIAPHADSLVLLLSERMAHQVITTRGKSRWYCLTLWCSDQQAMDTMQNKYYEMMGNTPEDDDSDLSGFEVD